MTIKDIARRCGVSVSTVSRVLNNHPDVSDAVRQKVQEVVRTHHYVPNNSARDLVKPQSDAIGLVVRGVGNPFYTEVILAIEQAVGQAGYVLVLHFIRAGEDELRAGAELVRSKKLQGLILLGGCFDYAPDDVALLNKVPFVCCSFTNSFGKLAEDSYSSVTINDQTEACRATQMLIAQGHRKIAILLDSVHDRSISELRYRGYCDALREAGLALDSALVQETGSFALSAAYAGTRHLLDRQKEITAIFAIADSLAMAAIKALHDCGKHIPDDCSVIAIDGIPMSSYTIPTLTTLSQPKTEMGKESVHMLIDMIKGQAGNRHLQLTTTLRTGGSICVAH